LPVSFFDVTPVRFEREGTCAGDSAGP